MCLFEEFFWTNSVLTLHTQVKNCRKEVDSIKAELNLAQAETKKALDANQNLNRMLTAVDEEAKALRAASQTRDKSSEDMETQLKEYKATSER